MTEILIYLFRFLLTTQYNLRNIASIPRQSLDAPLQQQQVCKRSYPNRNGNGIWAELVMRNKAGYTATPVACGWAGAIFEVSKAFGQLSSYHIS